MRQQQKNGGEGRRSGVRKSAIVEVDQAAGIVSGVLVLVLAMTCCRAEPGSHQRVRRVERITATKPKALSAVLSPDGAMLAYVTDASSGRGGIWIEDVDPDNPNPRHVAPSGVEPTWSPDGSTLSFFSTAPGAKPGDSTAFECSLVSVDLPSQVHSIGHSNVAWSPTSTWLARHDPLSGRLEIVRPDGSERRVLVRQGVGLAQPSPYAAMAWRPDGEAIAYSQWSRLEDGPQISVGWVELATAHQQSVMMLDQSQALVRVVWSPEGSRLGIAVVPVADIGAQNPEGSSLWVVSADGGQREQLLEEVGVIWGFDWSPSGESIAFVQGRGLRRDLWQVDVTTGEAEPLTVSGDVPLSVSWRDERTIVVDGFGAYAAVVTLKRR